MNIEEHIQFYDLGHSYYPEEMKLALKLLQESCPALDFQFRNGDFILSHAEGLLGILMHRRSWNLWAGYLTIGQEVTYFSTREESSEVALWELFRKLQALENYLTGDMKKFLKDHWHP